MIKWIRHGFIIDFIFLYTFLYLLSDAVDFSLSLLRVLITYYHHALDFSIQLLKS
jgi:hypothetical protein